VGSTFAFFVSCRVTDPPASQITGQASQLRPVLTSQGASLEEAMKAVKLSVLIVEDNLVNQKVLKKQLQKFGWTIYIAGNGEEALQWLRRSSYWRGKESTEAAAESDPKERLKSDPGSYNGDKLDLIFLDIEMPVMDGLTCVSRIRQWEDQGLLGLPRPGIRTQRSQSTTSLSPITPSQERRFRIPVLAVSANARMEQIQEALSAGMDDAISKPFRIPELWPKVQALVPRLSGQ
jgi:CheY-like chemotaxis protein